MSMEDAIVTAASAVVVAFLVTVAFIMGFRKRLRLDEAALAAARALVEHTSLPAREIAEAAMKIAGEICIYSNRNLVIEEI